MPDTPSASNSGGLSLDKRLERIEALLDRMSDRLENRVADREDLRAVRVVFDDMATRVRSLEGWRSQWPDSRIEEGYKRMEAQRSRLDSLERRADQGSAATEAVETYRRWLIGMAVALVGLSVPVFVNFLALHK